MDILSEDNYFSREFSARMQLMRKGLLGHIDPGKTPSEDDSNAANGKVNDMKAFAIISTMISPNLQSMVRSACSTAQAWDILKNFFLEAILAQQDPEEVGVT
uniref:AlNc14C14G1627 protein n=1 Tax=Albugo laibachii Nc14 TaxID=890382 RepID=F0W3W0_9STRA|nr:AlNc14C14G1627 [Albugo laibachii Nc14]|eukprot:CCA15710.1 AlNc14C14G1627 [Albugo laibachii Nc14]